MSNIFKAPLVSFGPVSQGEVIDFRFELKDGISPEQIEYIYPDCSGCTDAYLEGNAVIGQLKTEVAGIQSPQNEPKPGTKIVFVKMKDGQNYWVPSTDGKKRRLYNSQITVERLHLVGVVIAKEQ